MKARPQTLYWPLYTSFMLVSLLMASMLAILLALYMQCLLQQGRFCVPCALLMK